MYNRLLFVICSTIFLQCWVIKPIKTVTPVGISGDILQRRFTQLARNGVLEDIQLYPLLTKDGNERITRKAQLAIYDNARATIVVCHGFMCDKHDVSMFRGIFKHFNLLTFDFRGHGELVTENQICTFGKDETQEIITAVQFLKNHPNKNVARSRIIAYGFSMGAAAAILAQASQEEQNKHLFDGMILDCPFESSEEVIKRCIAQAKVRLFGYEFNIPGSSILERHAFHPYVQETIKYLLKAAAQTEGKDVRTLLYPTSPELSARHISVPCLFIHCKNDQRVPTDAVQRVYNNVPGFKRFWLTNGRRHFDSFFYNPDMYKKVVRKFSNAIAGQTLDTKVKEKTVDDRGALDVIGELQLITPQVKL